MLNKDFFSSNKVTMSRAISRRIGRRVRIANTDLSGRVIPERPSGIVAKTVAFYGPPRSGARHYLRDLEFWREDQPDTADGMEALWKHISEDEGR